MGERNFAFAFQIGLKQHKRMDLHNNSVGYYLGNQAIKNKWSEKELLKNVINAANDGTLKIGL